MRTYLFRTATREIVITAESHDEAVWMLSQICKEEVILTVTFQ